jgi:hypothetical protein
MGLTAMMAFAACRWLGRSLIILALALGIGPTMTACDESLCAEIVSRTALFTDYQRDPDNPGEFVPVGEPIAWAEQGENVEVLWRSDLKDQRIFRVRAADGTEGFIFQERGLGDFGVATPCEE